MKNFKNRIADISFMVMKWGSTLIANVLLSMVFIGARESIIGQKGMSFLYAITQLNYIGDTVSCVATTALIVSSIIMTICWAIEIFAPDD